MNTITSKNLCKRTGATYRQIDHWCNVGIIRPLGENNPGSGHQRLFNVEIVDRVGLLVVVSRSFKGIIHGEILKEVYDNYEQGFVNLDNGVRLSWRKYRF